jgi:hypothetical protein
MRQVLFLQFNKNNNLIQQTLCFKPNYFSKKTPFFTLYPNAAQIKISTNTHLREKFFLCL